MLDENEYQLIVHYSENRALHVIWNAWADHDCQTFIANKVIFLWILERLLREGQIKLHKNGTILRSSISEQVDMFSRAFPESEEDADRICTRPGSEAPYKGFGMNVWWFLDVCPAGVAWRQNDGSYLIAD